MFLMVFFLHLLVEKGQIDTGLLSTASSREGRVKER